MSDKGGLTVDAVAVSERIPPQLPTPLVIAVFTAGYREHVQMSQTVLHKMLHSAVNEVDMNIK